MTKVPIAVIVGYSWAKSREMQKAKQTDGSEKQK